MYTRTIETVEGFASLGEVWNDLLDRSRLSSPFLTFEWLEAWWGEYAGEHATMHVICCYDDAAHSLLGLLPTYVQRTSRPFPQRRLRFLGDGLGASLLDCIVDPEAAEHVLAAIADELIANSSAWDVLDLRRMTETSPFRALLADRLGQPGSRSVQEASGECPAVSLPPNWELYLGTLSRRERSRLKRLRRDLDAAGTLDIEEIDDSDALPGALEDALSMFEEGMSRKHERTFEVSERYRRFMQSVSESFLAQGRLRLIFLTVDGRRTAFLYQIRHGDTMFAYQTAFDESWASHHVGFAIFGYAIERAIAEGCACFSFGVGATAYKFRFGVTDVRDLQGIRVYQPTPAGRLAFGRDASARWGKNVIKRLSPAVVSERLSRAASWHGLERL